MAAGLAPSARFLEHWTDVDWSSHLRESTVAGRRVRYVDYGEGDPLLLVHGLGANWQVWLENIPDLARDHRVIALDLPGFGHSEALESPIGMLAYADGLAELLSDLDIERAVVVGHSMGGLICQLLTSYHPQRVKSLVLVAAAGVPLGSVRAVLTPRVLLATDAVLSRSRLAKAVIARPRLRRRLFGGLVNDPGCVSPLLAREIAEGMAAPGFAGALRAGVRADVTRESSRITAPTLIIWGRSDRLLPLSLGERLSRLIVSSRLEVWDDVGHSPMLERPTRFAEVVREFLAGLPAETGRRRGRRRRSASAAGSGRVRSGR